MTRHTPPLPIDNTPEPPYRDGDVSEGDGDAATSVVTSSRVPSRVRTARRPSSRTRARARIYIFLCWIFGRTDATMSVPVSTGCEVNTAPVEYTSGEMRTDLVDGDRARKVAFITGVTGQDRSYLVELLLAKVRARERRDATRRDGR